MIECIHAIDFITNNKYEQSTFNIFHTPTIPLNRIEFNIKIMNNNDCI